MFNKKKTLLGLDIGTFSAAAVEITWTDRGPEIVQCAYAEIPDEASRLDVLKNLVAENKFKGRRTAIALSGRTVIVRYVPMPPMSLPEMKKAIRFEAGKYIPFGLDEYTVDCEIVSPAGQGSDQMKVVLVAVKSSQITERIELARAAGLSPVIVDVDSFALCNVAHDALASQLAEGQVVAALDLGHSKTSVGILNGDDGFFTREFYVGGGDLNDQLSQALSVDPFELEKLKRDPGPRLPELQQATQSVVDDIVNEIKLSFDFFENEVDRRIDHVVLSGGVSAYAPLAESLRSSLGAPVEAWSPAAWARLTATGPAAKLLEEHPELFTVALGLAGRVVPAGQPGAKTSVPAPPVKAAPMPEPVAVAAETGPPPLPAKESGTPTEQSLDDILPIKPPARGSDDLPAMTGDDFGTTEP